MAVPYKFLSGEIVKDGGLRSGLNSTGSTIAAKLYVSGSDDSIAVAAGITTPVFGVTRHSIPDLTRGPIMQDGRAIVLVGAAGCTAGARQMPEAGGTGRTVDWAPGAGANATITGTAKTTQVSGDDVEVDLSPGSFGQGA